LNYRPAVASSFALQFGSCAPVAGASKINVTLFRCETVEPCNVEIFVADIKVVQMAAARAFEVSVIGCVDIVSVLVFFDSYSRYEAVAGKCFQGIVNRGAGEGRQCFGHLAVDRIHCRMGSVIQEIPVDEYPLVRGAKAASLQLLTDFSDLHRGSWHANSGLGFHS